MTAEMVEIITAHPLNESAACLCGSAWWLAHSSHAAHVAEELAKAGYGKLALHDIGS